MPLRGVIPHNLLMPMNQMEGVQQDIPRVISLMPAATRRRLREHRRASASGAGAGRSDDRADAAGAGAGRDAAAGHVPRRARAGRRRRSSPTRWPARCSPRSRRSRPSIAAADRDRLTSGRRRGLHERRAAGVHAAPRVSRQDLPARLPRHDRASTRCPKGAAMYAYNVRWHTTTTQTPQEIHEIGLAEVKRIRGEMDAIIAERRLQGQLRRVQAVPAHQSGVLLQGRRRRSWPATATSPSAPIRSWRGCSARCRARRTASRAMPDATRAVADDGVLRAGRARRRPARQHVREHLQARRAAEVGDGGADAARGGARASSADCARAGARGPAGVPEEHELHGVRRRLGALRREPRRRDGLLSRSVREVRPAHLRHVARRPARRRHRAALDGLDAPAGDRLLHGQRRQDASRTSPSKSTATSSGRARRSATRWAS